MNTHTISVIIFLYIFERKIRVINFFKKYKYIVIILLFVVLAVKLGIFLYEENKRDAEVDIKTTELFKSKGLADVYEPYKKLIPHFIIYEAYANFKPLKFVRMALDESSQYYVPYYALEKSDALIGYGIWHDIDFEDYFSREYNRHSYAFDCGIEESPEEDISPLCHFEPECLGTDECVLEELTSTQKVHQFPEKLKQLKIEKIPIYVRFDTGAERVPHILDDVLAHSDYITGFSFVIHCDDAKSTVLLEKILSEIEKDFILVARYTHHNHKIAAFQVPKTKQYFGMGMSLTYVNRKLVDAYHIKLNQDTNDIDYDGSLCYLTRSDVLLYRYIPYVIKTTFNDFVYEIKHIFDKNNFK